MHRKNMKIHIGFEYVLGIYEDCESVAIHDFYKYGVKDLSDDYTPLHEIKTSQSPSIISKIESIPKDWGSDAYRSAIDGYAMELIDLVESVGRDSPSTLQQAMKQLPHPELGSIVKYKGHECYVIGVVFSGDSWELILDFVNPPPRRDRTDWGGNDKELAVSVSIDDKDLLL